MKTIMNVLLTIGVISSCLWYETGRCNGYLVIVKSGFACIPTTRLTDEASK